MSQEEPSDLSALDSLFSRYGQGGARGLSEQRKKQIYAGKQQEDQESSNPTHKTLKAILDYEETIPDQEVDEFVTKIRDTRLLDDYPEDNLECTLTAPAYNPWPLDEDTSPATMADPLSGEILVTDLHNTEKNKPEPEEDETLDASAHQEDDPASSSESDIDDEEAEDLTEEFEKERAPKEDVSLDHHGDGDTQKDEDGDEDLFPRIDDDVDKDQSVKMVDVIEEEEEEKEEEEEEEDKEEEEEDEGEEEDKEDKEDKEEEKKEEDKEEDKNENDSSADTKDIEVDSRTSPVQINVELCEDSLDNADGITVTDGMTMESQGNTASTSEKSPQEKKKENVPDFETFLAELGVDPRETLDVEVQKSRARLSRLGPMAQRRPMTKRFSGGDEDRSKWMFVDSTEPKPQRLSIDEEDEDDEEKEEEKTPIKAPAPQPASKPGMRKPPGGIGLGPMVLPGLGAALGGTKLKKTPTSTPNKTFQKSIEESKVTISKSEPTRTTPLSSLKKTPPPASKSPPTTASKPLLIKKKPLAKPRPASQVIPSKEPSQPAWLKELKSKPKPEVKETKKEEDKLNSDILHPKTTPSETAPKSPSWMANSKTKKLPPIPSSSSSPKQEVESSTSNIPPWKQELMKKKKAPVPAPSSGVNKSPVKSRILPKSPTKSPAKPPIARKPGLPPKPSHKAGIDKGSDLKREEESGDQTDSKKIKLSQSMDSSLDEEKMDVTREGTPDEKPEEKTEVPKDDENKDDCQGKDVEMKQEEEEKEEEKEEEVKVVKTGEKKVIIIAKEKLEKEENKPFKPEEHKETMVTRNDVSQNTVQEKQDDEVNKKGGENMEVKKDEKKTKTDKPKIEKEETSKVKPVQIFMKTNSKKEEPKEEKAEEKKVTIVTKSDSKMDETKKLQQKKVTIVTKTEDKNSDSDSSMPKWKREARERMQKRKMSGGNIVPIRSPKDTIETSNNNTPLWKKELVEKRKLFPKMPSLDNEEKGSVESQKSEKVLKRHTIAADVPTISVPAGHKMGTPTWKQELEKKNARLAKHLAVKDAERDKD